MKEKKYVLGVDGGGSKTTAILVALDGSVIADLHTEATNPQNLGYDVSASILVGLIRDICQKANCSIAEIKSVVMGIAGIGRQRDVDALLNSIETNARKQKLQLPQIRMETDARIALEAAFASGPGIALIAGTGSIAIAKNEDGKIFRLGGWGRVLGDEGSGYSIALNAIKAAIKAHEGRGDRTALLNLVIEHFECESLEELIYKIKLENAEIASFAPKVLKAAMEFDHISHNILFNQANELAELVRTLVNKIHPKKKIPVALMGGLLENENIYSKMVKERVSRSLPQIVIQKPKFPTAFGAAILGLNAFNF